MKDIIYIYTLLLEGGNYYVGQSINVDKRVRQHFKRKGSEWTKLHKPIERISCEKRLVSSMDEACKWENHFTLKLMREKGWNRVRGGFWCNICGYDTLLNLHSHGFFLEFEASKKLLQKTRHIIYLLALENDKYYLGCTMNLKSAIKMQTKGKGSIWTARNKPISSVPVMQIPCICKPDIEDVNKILIKRGYDVGFENIRGGSFVCQSNSFHMKQVHKYIKNESHIDE